MRENNLWVKQKCVILFNKTVPDFETVLLWTNEQNYCSYKPVFVVINQSIKTNYSTIGAFLDRNDTYVISYFILIMLEYILKQKWKKIYSVFVLPDVTTKSYREIIQD